MTWTSARSPSRSRTSASRPPRLPSRSGPGRRQRCVGEALKHDTDLPLPNGFDVFALGYSDLSTLAEEIARYAADVVVLEPIEIRKAVIHRLRAVAALAGVA